MRIHTQMKPLIETINLPTFTDENGCVWYIMYTV